MQKFEGKYFHFFGIHIAQILTEYTVLLYLYIYILMTIRKKLRFLSGFKILEEIIYAFMGLT